VIASAAIFSPRSVGTTNRRCCSGVPNRTIIGSAMPWLPRPTTVPTLRPATTISSDTTSVCVRSPPPPPSSSG
jgi:hypothetical protein